MKRTCTICGREMISVGVGPAGSAGRFNQCPVHGSRGVSKIAPVTPVVPDRTDAGVAKGDGGVREEGDRSNINVNGDLNI